MIKGLREFLKKKQGVPDRQNTGVPCQNFMYRKVFRQEERHLAHKGGHVTEVVKDNVGHAVGQQESRRGTSTVPVPPHRARAARGEGGMGQDAQYGQA